jgi:hypothetical protein
LAAGKTLMYNTFLKTVDFITLTMALCNLILFCISFHKVKKDSFNLLKKKWQRNLFFPLNILVGVLGIAIFFFYVKKYGFVLTVFGVQKPLSQYLLSKTFVNLLLFIWFVLVTLSLNIICLVRYDKGIKPLVNKGELVMVTSLFSVVLVILIQMMLKQLFIVGDSRFFMP